jgi:hypothetical protein
LLCNCNCIQKLYLKLPYQKQVTHSMFFIRNFAIIHICLAALKKQNLSVNTWWSANYTTKCLDCQENLVLKILSIFGVKQTLCASTKSSVFSWNIYEIISKQKFTVSFKWHLQVANALSKTNFRLISCLHSNFMPSINICDCVTTR